MAHKRMNYFFWSSLFILIQRIIFLNFCKGDSAVETVMINSKPPAKSCENLNFSYPDWRSAFSFGFWMEKNPELLTGSADSQWLKNADTE